MNSLPALAILALATFPASAATQVLNGHVFTLPSGFIVELVAGSNLVPRPVSASFDPDGRLYVTDSSGSNKPPAEQLKDPSSRIVRLEDTDGDGHFDRSTVFADKVMFPQGCLWHAGSVYVAGPPSIWKFTDTDGDGVADRREEWYQGKVLTGCANDVHGPYRGPEGMLYWTKGAFSRLDLKDGHGRPIQDRCAHIFRAWPDGTGLETVASGGMDNPVEVAFSNTGEAMIISTFIDLSQPGRRDGLAHAVYGGVFGKINDVVDEPMVRRTGDLLPAMTHFGPAAACALMRYEGAALGSGYQDNLFATLFNLRKVTRHILKPTGATFATDDSDFLASDQLDFHPTDVLEDADGSLLVVDTGGWYKLCCPSSQLAKADVFGAIYRVTKPGIGPLAATDRKAGYARLVQPPTLRGNSQQVELRRAAFKAEPASAPHLRRALAENASKSAGSPEAAHLARIAAEGLGRIGDREAVPILFRALSETPSEDRFLEHALLYALIEIGDAEGVRRFLTSSEPVSRRAALLVMDQINPGQILKISDVLPSLNASDARLRTTAQWVVRRHPDWGSELSDHVRQRLLAKDAAPEEKASWEALLGLFAQSAQGQTFLAEAATQSEFRAETRLAALNAIAGAGSKSLLPAWRDAVIAALKRASGTTPSPSEAASAIRTARSLPVPKEGDSGLTTSLLEVARNPRLSTPLRIDAFAALPQGAGLNSEDVAFLIASLAPDKPPAERLSAATAISRGRLDASQMEALTRVLGGAGPIELPRLLAAYAPGGDDALGTRVITSLRESKSLRSLRPEELKTAMAAFPTSIQTAAQELLASVQSDPSQDRARLDAVLGEVEKLQGQVRSGQALFNSTKAACSACHRLGYLGGDVGPDLTSIGTIRSERDLLESVLYPSASLVRSYEPWTAATMDGEEYSGVLRRDTPEEIVLATGPGAEVHIARSNLRELRLGQLSTMPAGLEEQLSRQELADLIAFLKNTKWGVN